MNNAWKYFFMALVVLLIDQTIKLAVHFGMEMGVAGQIKLLGNWFKLQYILNPGMALGIRLGFLCEKVLLTTTRLVATVLIGRYVWQSAQIPSQSYWLLRGWSLVLGGTTSNSIDAIFYGVLLNNAPCEAPTPWFHGQVIDMFYLDIWPGQLSSWVPWLADQYVTCLPIFNVADVVILAGIVLVLWNVYILAAPPQCNS